MFLALKLSHNRKDNSVAMLWGQSGFPVAGKRVCKTKRTQEQPGVEM